MKKFRLKFNLFILLIAIVAFVWIAFSTVNTWRSADRRRDPNKPIIECPNEKPNPNNGPNSIKADYVERYKFILSCNNEYNGWQQSKANKTLSNNYNYSAPAPVYLQSLRIIRAFTIYFPVDKVEYFEYELRWLYRSWVHMISFEPEKWRTDLVIFIENKKSTFDNETFFMNGLNCSFKNERKSPRDKPMCVLRDYLSLSKRNITSRDKKPLIKNERFYNDLLRNLDIFNTDGDAAHFNDFYLFVKESLVTYNYLDSILMGFDGYDYFVKAGYDFIIRSDMDVFLTPLFSTWLPRHCNDFNVGRGGYSNTFNTKRFRRIANNLNITYAAIENMGSTWYSTPHQVRLVAYLTLFGMAYLSNEEFTQPERELKVGVILWPEWHYGVLLLYGQHLALNHLIASEQINLVKLENHLDYPSGNNHSIYNMIHIHVFHGDNLFSKFVFKMGKYANATVEPSDEVYVNSYALKMALDGKKISPQNLHNMLVNVSQSKN